MIFCPHILQKRVEIPVENDEYGRPKPGTGGYAWQTMCDCRCDDNTTKEFRSEDGHVYRPAYHVVCDGKPKLKAGDHIRCLNKDDRRGEGAIYAIKSTNYFNYSEIWI